VLSISSLALLPCNSALGRETQDLLQRQSLPHIRDTLRLEVKGGSACARNPDIFYLFNVTPSEEGAQADRAKFPNEIEKAAGIRCDLAH
jgi:hypothetical protein